jgi:hypothetical protein
MPATRTPRIWTTTTETKDTLVMVSDDGAQVAAIRLSQERYLTTRRMRYPPDE